MLDLYYRKTQAMTFDKLNGLRYQTTYHRKNNQEVTIRYYPTKRKSQFVVVFDVKHRQ